MNKCLRFLREDGFYVFAAYVLTYFAAAVRSRLIGRKLGVRKIKIGSRAYLRGLSSVAMGEDFSAGAGLWLEAVTHYNDQIFQPRIIIGKHVRISQSVHIACTHLVEIGDNVLIGSKVIITDHNHGHYSGEYTSPRIPPSFRPLEENRRVIIAQNVWLGDGVVVTPGSAIGEGSVIGANSVVLGVIPAYTIAAGIPATARKTFNFAAQKWDNIE